MISTAAAGMACAGGIIVGFAIAALTVWVQEYESGYNDGVRDTLDAISEIMDKRI